MQDETGVAEAVPAVINNPKIRAADLSPRLNEIELVMLTTPDYLSAPLVQLKAN